MLTEAWNKMEAIATEMTLKKTRKKESSHGQVATSVVFPLASRKINSYNVEA